MESDNGSVKAHQINNHLTVIRINAQAIASACDKMHPLFRSTCLLSGLVSEEFVTEFVAGSAERVGELRALYDEFHAMVLKPTTILDLPQNLGAAVADMITAFQELLPSR